MSHRVLIVDDEPSIVISLEFLMKQAGHEVSVARNGQDGLEQISAFRPDLVLLDVMLPHRTGFEICQIVREDEALEHVKIVLLTAKGREVDVAKGLALGADAYVTKPFSTKELVHKVSTLLSA
ncbi:MAG: response regulator [Bacteroidota bacterium]